MDQESQKEEVSDRLVAKSLDDLFDIVEKLNPSKDMAWFGISGSWRKANEEVESLVRETVQKIMAQGGGIVSGGALNVDYFATDEALKINPEATRIKIFLPVVLELYAAHYRRRADEGVITHEQAEQLIAQLEKLKIANPLAIIENTSNTIVDQQTYFERNTEVVKTSDALVGFQVNDSEGVGDTLAKALDQGKPVLVTKYKL